MFHFIKTANKGKSNIKNLSKMKLTRQNPQAVLQPPIFDNMMSAKTVSLFSQPYLDRYNQCYKNIVVINLPPQGPLGSLVKKVNFQPLSEF